MHRNGNVETRRPVSDDTFPAFSKYRFIGANITSVVYNLKRGYKNCMPRLTKLVKNVKPRIANLRRAISRTYVDVGLVHAVYASQCILASGYVRCTGSKPTT
jgi:hypothetical protein